MHSKNTTQRNDKNHSKQRQIIKFQRVLKQNIGSFEPLKDKNRLHDPQYMKDKIQALKQQNCELKQVIKIQQTQLHYLKQQQKNIAINSPLDEKQRIHKKNILLQQKVQKLTQQCNKIKKSCKYSHSKQLQISNEQYLQQIKFLTAKLKSLSSNSHNVAELNKIIQKQYFTSLKNQSLEKQINQKNLHIQKSEKFVIKLKNSLQAKNREIQSLKDNLEQLTKQTKKIRNLDDYVHKSQLIAKKKQLLSMSQTIQNLQIKLAQCQNKAQSLQQQNIDNMNRQAAKKKQMITAYQNLKQKCSQLQSLLIQSTQLSQSNIQNMNLHKVSQQSQLINKPKIPYQVHKKDIGDIVHDLIYTFQANNIQRIQGIQLLIGRISWEDFNSLKHQQILCKSINFSHQELVQKSISIHQIITILGKQPFNITQYNKKQLFARYCTQNMNQQSNFIQFHSKINISYVYSILKQVIPNYCLFTEQQKCTLSMEVEKYLTIHQFFIKEALKDSVIQKQVEINMNKSLKFSRMKLYICQDIINYIRKQDQLSTEAIQFIEFRTYYIRKSCISYQQLVHNFKIEEDFGKDQDCGQYCVFLTQRDKQVIDFECVSNQEQNLQKKQITAQQNNGS